MADADQLAEAAEAAIRYHFYDTRRGDDSADPGRNGIGLAIEWLSACFDSSRLSQLEAEGRAWADYELSKPYDVTTGGQTTWEEARQSLKGDATNG